MTEQVDPQCHQWEEVRRVYTRGPSGDHNFGSCSQQLSERLTFGVTSVELRCFVCGDITERLLTGDHTDFMRDLGWQAILGTRR